MERGVTAPALPTPRRAGVRMALAGVATMLVGLALLIFVDRATDRALSFPEIGSRPPVGVQFIAGLPATLGYVIAALGLYRFLTNRAPGEESQAKVAVAARGVLIAVLALAFFAGAFGITMIMRLR